MIQFKNGQKFEQTLHHEKYINGKKKKNLKRCSTSLVINVMQIKIKGNATTNLIRVTKMKKTEHIKCLEECVQMCIHGTLTL